MSFWGNKCIFEAILINVKATNMILIARFHYHLFSSGRSIILDNLSEGKRGRIRVCVIPTFLILLRTVCGLVLYISYCRQARGAYLMPLWRARLIKERSGSLLMPTCFKIGLFLIFQARFQLILIFQAWFWWQEPWNTSLYLWSCP